MSIVTAHWSGTPAQRERAYHLEFMQRQTPLQANLLQACRDAQAPSDVPWVRMYGAFAVYKNVNFDTAMDYGCFGWNHDFRDNSPNIEVAAMCMGGPHTGTRNFGEWPYTKAHAWMHAYLIAMVCRLKGIDPLESFKPVQGFMNGPLYSVSTHGERAYQTQNKPIDRHNRGYGLYGDDPDCRWDLAILDPHDIDKLGSYNSARKAVTDSANWLRSMASKIKHDSGFTDHFNLAQPV